MGAEGGWELFADVGWEPSRTEGGREPSTDGLEDCGHEEFMGVT
jgi:hypothetical protein